MKISIARKNLFHEKTRFFISVGGIAFAVMLILVLLGLYRGWNEKTAEYANKVEADIWVVQNGVKDMSHSVSLLPNSYREQIAEIDGIQAVNMVLGRRVIFKLDGEEVTTTIIGFNTESGVGGPYSLLEGTGKPQEGEIVIDKILAQEHNLKLGDTLSLLENKYTITGISESGAFFQFSFISFEDARVLFKMNDLFNYVLVSLDENADQEQVIQDIESKLSNVDAQTKKEFANNSKKEITEIFLPIIFVLVFICFVVGLMIISLTIYTATVEKSREYGVIKAIGARNWQLYRTIFEQSVITGIFGYGIGTGLTYAISYLAEKFEPMFVTYVVWQDLLLVLGIVVTMVIVAAYVPIRRVVGIDPAIVFK